MFEIKGNNLNKMQLGICSYFSLGKVTLISIAQSLMMLALKYFFPSCECYLLFSLQLHTELKTGLNYMNVFLKEEEVV